MMNLASDYIHPYKDAGDAPHTAEHGSTSPMTFATFLWLSARSCPTTLEDPLLTQRRR